MQKILDRSFFLGLASYAQLTGCQYPSKAGPDRATLMAKPEMYSRNFTLRTSNPDIVTGKTEFSYTPT